MSLPYKTDSKSFVPKSKRDKSEKKEETTTNHDVVYKISSNTYIPKKKREESEVIEEKQEVKPKKLHAGDVFINEDNEEEVKQIENSVELIPMPLVIGRKDLPRYADIETEYKPFFKQKSKEMIESEMLEEEYKSVHKYYSEIKEYKEKVQNDRVQNNVDEQNGEMFVNDSFMIQRSENFDNCIELIKGENVKDVKEKYMRKLDKKIFISFMLPVKLIGGLRDIDELTGVFIGAAFELMSGAFYNCYNLEEVYLPKTITTIPTYCFYNCHNLVRVIGGEYVQIIDDYAFSNCEKLHYINFYRTRYIGKGAFLCCHKLKKIAYVVDFLEYIGKEAFQGTGVSKIITRRITIDLIGIRSTSVKITKKLRILVSREEPPVEILFSRTAGIKRPSEKECDILEKKLMIYEILTDKGMNPEEVRKELFNIKSMEEEYIKTEQWKDRVRTLEWLNPKGAKYELAITHWFGVDPHEIPIIGEPVTRPELEVEYKKPESSGLFEDFEEFKAFYDITMSSEKIDEEESTDEEDEDIDEESDESDVETDTTTESE